MAILNAKELRQRECPEILIDIGDGQQVLARRPDLATLVYENIMPMPLLSAVAKAISGYADIAKAASEAGDGAAKKEVTVEEMGRNAEMRKFVDTWVCAAMVQPRAVQPPPPIVIDGQPPTAQPPFVVPDDAVLVTDLTLATRTQVFRETFSFGPPAKAVAVAAAERFPDVGDGATPGPDVPTLQPEAVGSAEP